MNQSVAKRGISKRLIAHSILVVLAASGVSWLSLDATQSVSERTDTLVSRHVPQLRAIGNLRDEIHRRVLTLYLYYATMEDDHWRKSENAHSDFEDQLAVLRGLGVADSETSWAAELADRVERHAQLFHAEMQGRRNWDVLREHLADTQSAATELDSALTSWTESIREQAGEGGNQTLQDVAWLTNTQIGFSVVILLIALFVVGMVRARLKDQEELYRRAYHDRLTGIAEPSAHGRGLGVQRLRGRCAGPRQRC